MVFGFNGKRRGPQAWIDAPGIKVICAYRDDESARFPVLPPYH
jgi:hypothetical protein